LVKLARLSVYECINTLELQLYQPGNLEPFDMLSGQNYALNSELYHPPGRLPLVLGGASSRCGACHENDFSANLNLMLVIVEPTEVPSCYFSNHRLIQFTIDLSNRAN